MTIMGSSFSDESRTLIEGELDKILSSRQFASAPAVRTFLRFVVSEVIAGRGGRLKAYTIATEAFGRNAEFDPSNDTIVRTTAGRVRRALETYYRECDADSRVVISLPKGRYAPAFEFREPPPPAQAEPTSRAVPASQPSFRPGMWTAACLATVLVLASAFVASFWWRADGPDSGQMPLPTKAVIDVLPTEYTDPQTQSLAREIDLRLAPALSRIGLAEVTPPSTWPLADEGAAPASDFADNSIPFILKTSVTNSANPLWFWQLIDAESGRLVWASKVPLSGADAASIDRAVDKAAFQVLGRRGALPSAFAKYRGNIFSKPTCLSRVQIVEVIENNAVYPEMRQCLEGIVADSPGDASAWAVLSTFYNYRSGIYAGSYEQREALVERAEYAAQKAVELAPGAYLTKVALMKLALRQGRIAEFDALQQEIRANYPGDIYLQIHIATRLARLGRGREALEIFDRARNDFGIDLKNWSPGIAIAYFVEGEYEHAYRETQRITSRQRFVLALKVAVLGKLGMREEATPIIEELVSDNPDIKETLYSWLTSIGWVEPVMLEFADGLAKGGLIVSTDAPPQSSDHLTGS